MMMKTIAALLFSAVLVVTANAQAGMNVCTQMEQMAVFTDLGLNLFTCGLPLATAIRSDTFMGTDAGVSATRNACTGDCIGSFAQGLLCQCSRLEAEGLRAFCYRSTGRITFCRESFVGVVNPNISLAVGGLCLANFTSAECPAGCAAALQALVAEIGCCYQTIYNNSILTASLPDEQTRQLFMGLNNALLWNICNVMIPTVCPEPDGIAALDAAACVTTTPETTASETTAPETTASETTTPETTASQTTTPETTASETTASQTIAPETNAPDTNAPESTASPRPPTGSAPGLLATKAVAVFLLLLAYFAM